MLPSFLRQNRAALEAIARRRCHSVRLNDSRLICRVLGKYIVYVDPEDYGITPHLCLNGFWESWITLALARIVKPGWRCVDLGANHGYYTLLLADAVGPSGYVLAVEPNPRLAELLELSIEVNGFGKQAAVKKIAVSDHAATGLLAVPRHRAMDATIYRPPTDDDEPLEVETMTPDQLTMDWPRVDLIKIDVEGAEEAAWRGLRRTIEQNPDLIILMEMKCSRYAAPENFVRSIQSAGFPLRWVDYDGEIKDISAEQILTASQDQDWMLFLQR